MTAAPLLLLAVATAPAAASPAVPVPASPALAGAPPALARVLTAPEFAAAAAALRVDHPRFVDEIIRIAEIPAPPFGEAPRARAFADLMRRSGIAEVGMDELGNVVGVRPGRVRTLGPVVIAAHLDTVFPAGTNIAVRRQGTRLMAPGIGDDARGLALLLAFARALDRAALATERDILFVGNVGEEGPGDLRGIRHLFTNDPRVRGTAAFITVDGNGASMIASRGVGSRRYRLVFAGPGGHSYDKFGLVNPMVPLAKTVSRLYATPVPRNPRTTYAASMVAGGTSVNSIPARVHVDIDIRSVAPREVDRVDAHLRAIARQAVEEENAARSTARGRVSVVFERIGDRPAGASDESKGLAPLAFAASRAFGYQPRYIAVSTDANLPMSLGIPAIGIGSGGSGGAEHSPDEWIDVGIEESVRGMSVGLATLVAAAGLAGAGGG